MLNQLDSGLASWLDACAYALDTDRTQADGLLPVLAASALLRVGVPVAQGGTGGTSSDTVAIAAQLAQHSLAAAFVFWAQRAVIECLLQSPNHELVRELLPSLLDGSLAGAPALSNAMRSLSGLDRLHTQLTRVGEGVVLKGAIPSATNLRRKGFVVATAAIDPTATDGRVAIYAVPHSAAGVWRGEDQELLGLQATNTAALHFDDVRLGDRWLIHPQAKAFLPKLRPAMLAIQCGLGLGLANASLHAARENTRGESILMAEIESLARAAGEYWHALSTALDEGLLETTPAELLELRIRMVGLATSAVHLELQALGARAYDRSAGQGFARRMREATFLPILTPSLVQLKTEVANVRKASQRPVIVGEATHRNAEFPRPGH